MNENGAEVQSRSTGTKNFGNGVKPVITARCTIVQSAVLRSHVVCPSVICHSVCLSVKLVDQDDIGGKSWKLIARTNNN